MKTWTPNPLKLLAKIRWGLPLALIGCGTVGGGVATFNDPVPSGTVVAQGSFSGRNNQTVTGSAIVYLTTSGTYILRLQSISTPVEAALQITAVVNGTSTALTALKGYSGNQNYTTSFQPTATWTSVSIKSTSANPSVAEYGIALFTSP